MKTFNFFISDGNYIPCSKNLCQNEGSCLPMSTSPSPKSDFSGKKSLDSFGNFFIPNGNRQNWYDAETSCQNQSGHLIKITDSTAFIKGKFF